VGRVESDGTLRKSGSMVGRIESDGTIRHNGSYWGKAEGCSDFEGARKVAAVLFFWTSDF